MQSQNTNPNWMGVYDGDKNKRAGKWGLQLIYRFSYPNERPGVWMAVTLVCLCLYQPKAERPCCKDGLLAHLDLLWITFVFKKNYWCHWVLCLGRLVMCVLVPVTTLVPSIVFQETEIDRPLKSLFWPASCCLFQVWPVTFYHLF